MRDGQLPNPPSVVTQVHDLGSPCTSLLSPHQDIFPPNRTSPSWRRLTCSLLGSEPTGKPASHVFGDWNSEMGLRSAGRMRWCESGMEVTLLLLAEDATREPLEVGVRSSGTGATDQAENAGQMDDVCAYVEGVGEGQRLHGLLELKVAMGARSKRELVLVYG